MTDAERIAALEAENAALRAELEHWRTAHQQQVRADREGRYGAWPVGTEKLREVVSEPVPWPKGTIVTKAPAPRQLCETCTAKMERGEVAVCGCIQSGGTVTC